MAKRKVVGQSGNRNLSKVDRSAWGKNKNILKTLTGTKIKQGEFTKSKSMKNVLSTMRKKEGMEVFQHNGFSKGNLAGVGIKAIKGNKKQVILKAVYGEKGGTAKAYTYKLNKKDVQGAMASIRKLYHDPQYKALAKQTGTKVHGANSILMNVANANAKKVGATVQLYDQNGNMIKQSKITPKPKNPSTKKVPMVGKEIVSNVGGQQKMTKQQFKDVDTHNITPEQWGQMTSGQKFLTIARMSSPAFKADKANKYAKKMETKAKNISRGIGIAGKAIGGIGRGISSGYRKGWGSR